MIATPLLVREVAADPRVPVSAVRFLVDLVDTFGVGVPFAASVRDLAGRFGVNKDTAGRSLSVLADVGALLLVEPARGPYPARYAILDGPSFPLPWADVRPLTGQRLRLLLLMFGPNMTGRRRLSSRHAGRLLGVGRSAGAVALRALCDRRHGRPLVCYRPATYSPGTRTGRAACYSLRKCPTNPDVSPVGHDGPVRPHGHRTTGTAVHVPTRSHVVASFSPWERLEPVADLVHRREMRRFRRGSRDAAPRYRWTAHAPNRGEYVARHARTRTVSPYHGGMEPLPVDFAPLPGWTPPAPQPEPQPEPVTYRPDYSTAPDDDHVDPAAAAMTTAYLAARRAARDAGQPIPSFTDFRKAHTP